MKNRPPERNRSVLHIDVDPVEHEHVHVGIEGQGGTEYNLLNRWEMEPGVDAHLPSVRLGHYDLQVRWPWACSRAAFFAGKRRRRARRGARTSCAA